MIGCWCKTCDEDTNETTWPKITIVEDRIKITYPIDRPYTKEITEFMKSKDYVLVGVGNTNFMIELTFVSAESMGRRVEKLLRR
jgi:hypothetical protein